MAVTSSQTLTAIAVKTGYQNSPSAKASYVITPVLATPRFSVVAGTYSSAQTVSISASTGATIYYTINGNTPRGAQTKYMGVIKVNSTETLKADRSRNRLDPQRDRHGRLYHSSHTGHSESQRSSRQLSYSTHCQSHWRSQGRNQRERYR